MKKMHCFLAALLLLTGCTTNQDDSQNDIPYNLNLEMIQAMSEANIGFPMNVTMTISSDRKAEKVPYTLMLVNKSDHDSDVENPRYISLGEFETIDTIEEGTNTYDVQVVIPDESGQTGQYYLVGIIDPAGDVDGEEGKLDNIDLFADPDKYDMVNLDPKYKDDTDFSFNGVNLGSASSDNANSDVFVIRDTDKLTAPVITGSVTVKTLGLKPRLNVPIAVYLMNETGSGRELIPGKLWDNEIKGYVEKYYIAELVPETPSVVHFSMSLPLETRSYIRQNRDAENKVELRLVVAVDPDNSFTEPTIPGVLNGETNNLSNTAVTVVYDGTPPVTGGGSGDVTDEVAAAVASIDTATPIGQWVNDYDNSDDNLVSINSEIGGRTGGATLTLGNNIYIFGGKDASGNVLDSVEVYDMTSGTWSIINGVLGTARYDHSAVATWYEYWGGYIVYIIGGRDSVGNPLDSMECLIASPDEGYISDGYADYSLQHSRYGHTSVINGNYLYVIGGVGAERSVEVYYHSVYHYEMSTLQLISDGPSLNQGRSFHGSEICYIRDAADRTNEKAVIVVAGGIQNGQSTGSIEILDLERDAVNSPVDGESLFVPSASNTWHRAGSSIETTLASMSTANLKINSDSTEQLLYLFGGQKVYKKTETICPSAGDFSLSDCTTTERQVSEPQSIVWRYNPFSDTLERVNVLPNNSPRSWASMAVYTDSNGNNFAYLIGGTDTGDGAETFDTPGMPSAETIPLSVSYYGFHDLHVNVPPVSLPPVVYDPDSPSADTPQNEYPTERKQCELGGDPYGGRADIVGAGINCFLGSKYTTSGYKFDCQLGVVVDLFSERYNPVITDIRAYHYVNPTADDLMQTKIIVLGQTLVLYQEKGINVGIALSDFRERIAQAIEEANAKKIAEGAAESAEEDTAQTKEDEKKKKKKSIPYLMNPNIFDYQCSLFDKLRLPKNHRIGPFFGLYIILQWDAGLKAGWDFAVGFEKAVENNVILYNRFYVRPNAYGSVYGYLSAGVSAGSVITLGIDADFDIIRIDIVAVLAHNFKIAVPTDQDFEVYGTKWSLDFTGTLSLVKGQVNAYVEMQFIGICSKKKWGIRWYYPCLKRTRENLPWPNISFCAYSMTLWDLHAPFPAHYSNWVLYDSTINLSNDTEIRPGLELLDAYQLIFNL